MSKIIEFNNVSKEYSVGINTVKALDNASFSVNEGEFVVILGPSGAGKSTLLNLLGGMDNASSGDIIVNNKVVSEFKDKLLTEYRAKEIGFVFQFYNLIPSLMAIENVSIVRDIVKEPLDEKEVLTLVGLENQMYQFPGQLSGGEQQRVSIARAIAKNPTMLLCDEPTGALDSETGIVVLELLHKMSRDYKKPVIIVTHNTALAEAADKVIKIKNGKIKSITINESPIAIREVNY